MRVSVGIKNNNPLNVRFSSLNRWQGLVGSENGFCKFESVKFGLRAGLITLRTYINKHGLYSVKDIISRWAPSSENPTRNYISFVSKCISDRGCNPNDIKFGSPAFLTMVVAMCMFESWYRCCENDIYECIINFNLN